MASSPPAVSHQDKQPRHWADLYRSLYQSRRVTHQPKPVKIQKIMNNSSVFPEDYPVHHEESLDHHVIHSPGHENQPQNQQQSQSEPRAKDYVGVDEVTKIGFLAPLLAEALGTCLLVIIGCASCINWGTPPSVLHIALTFGLAVASLAHVFGPISGCHVNPAVSMGLLVSGNCTILRALSYIVIQCCGAVAGAEILKMLTPAVAASQGLGMTLPGNGTTVGQAVVIEAIITFLLVLVVHGVTDPRREDCKGWAPLAIGLTISVAHMAAVPLTGSSMNPARTLGPAAILGIWQDIWVYWVGPIAGGVVAGILYRFGLRPKSKDEEDSYDF